MPALNIKFTDEELELLREQARTQGCSMTSLAHDLVVSRSERDRHDEIIKASAARVRSLNRDLLERLADR
jgi:hypothetical protein